MTPKMNEKPLTPGATLRAWRKGMGWTLRGAARRLGMSPPAFSALENDKAPPPKLDVALALWVASEGALPPWLWATDPIVRQAAKLLDESRRGARR